MTDKKYRRELKFIISIKQAEVLKHRLSMLMEVDTNSVNQDNTYYIRSLYFDDLKQTAYHDKIDGVENREKYRIRIYNMDDSFIRLERKEKNGNLTRKYNMTISKEICLQLLDGSYDRKLMYEDNLLGDFTREIETRRLVPSVIVDYRRLAYTFPVEDTRVTFDEGVSSGRFDYNLFSKDLLTHDVFSDQETVLEVKFNDNIPSHIASVINSIPTIRQAISKFTFCYEKKEV